VKHDAR
jgi:hypothetical protein